MNLKLMLAFATFLGFSTACSTVKNISKEGEKSPKDTDSVIIRGYAPDTTRRVMVMYGVPIPKADTTGKLHMQKSIGVEELTPVTERAHPEDDPQPGKPSGK